jgi:hypothetical protein
MRWFIYKLADLDQDLDAVMANTGDGTKPPKTVEAFHPYCANPLCARLL